MSICNHIAPDSRDQFTNSESSLSSFLCMRPSSSSKARMKMSRYLIYRLVILGNATPSVQPQALLTGLSCKSHHGTDANSCAGPMYDHSRSTTPMTVRSFLLRTMRFARPRSSQISLNLHLSYFLWIKSGIRARRTLKAIYLFCASYLPKTEFGWWRSCCKSCSTT